MKSLSGGDVSAARINKLALCALVLILMVGLVVVLNHRSMPIAGKANTATAKAQVGTVNRAGTDLALGPTYHARSDDPRTATIVVAGRPQKLVPNVRGAYPRVAVSAGATIHADVPIEEAAPGASIAVQAEDGGSLQGAASAGVAKVDGRRVASVDFKASNFDGIQRVTLRFGGRVRALEFWVGPAQPVLARN